MSRVLSYASLPSTFQSHIIKPSQIELWYLKNVQTNDLCYTEFFEMEVFDPLTE